MSYSNEEYFNMLMCLGRCNCNYAQARRLYEELYAVPRNVTLPSAQAFQRLHMRVYSTGSVHGRDSHRADAGRPRLHDSDDDVEEQVLDMFGEDTTRYSDEENESDTEAKVKIPKPLKDGMEDSDGSFNPNGSEADSDFDPEGGEGASGAGRKRRAVVRRRSAGKGAKRGKRTKGKRGKPASKGSGGKKAKSESEHESDKSESERGREVRSGSEGEESDEPKSKRVRVVVPAPKGPSGAVAKPASVQATPVKEEPHTPVKQEPSTPVKQEPPMPVKQEPPTPVKQEPSTPVKQEPPTPPGKKKASSEEESGEGSEEEDEEGSEEEESGEESDTPADKKAKRPPTDDEIKKYVQQILEGANLEHITMKTVYKRVYNHFPGFYLAHKKDFIKATVNSLISS